MRQVCFGGVILRALFFVGAYAAAAAAATQVGLAGVCQAAPDRIYEVTLASAEGDIPLESAPVGVRTASPPGALTAFTMYGVLEGESAALRLNPQPSFSLILPSIYLDPHNRFALAALAVRRNGTREILLGQGLGSGGTDLPRDRRVALSITPAADQSGVTSGYRLYRVTPLAPLRPGEYAIVIHGPQEAASPDRNGVQSRFFAFGVDRTD